MTPAAERALSQLAALASQHHASDYNRLKFGPHGCPTKYLPLSLHLPDFFHQLQERQIQCSQEDPWSFSPRPPPPAAPVLLGPCGTLPHDHRAAHLEEDIRAALASSLDIAPRCAPAELRLLLDPSIKTSSTHPINISPIVPPSLLPILTSHLISPVTPSPTVFHVPPSFALTRLIQHPLPCPPTVPPIPPNPYHRQSIADAFQAAISRRFSNRLSPSLITRSTTVPLAPASPDPAIPENLHTKHANQSSLSLSLSLTIQGPSHPSLGYSDQISRSSVSLDSSSSIPSSPSILFGNLFLSSCPGKKVRLDGPVKGRTGVCRDLDMDLKRMKELGVGCVICCLDDVELDFLGAPWSKYEELAGKNGIDVLRIPTPEGLAPLTPASLDNQLTKVIDTYTLSGIPVLVHCRGGVGRAGVIACCWLIRLGLCGWVKDEDQASASPMCPTYALDEVGTSGLKTETVQFVEGVIAVVRRRRSMKAIETYEQVRFLVDFVEYLRQGRDIGAPA